MSVKTKTVVETGRAEKGAAERVSTVVSFRVTADENKRMRQRAEEQGMSFSEWARELLTMEGGDPEQGTLWSEARDAMVEELDEEAMYHQEQRFLDSIATSARSLARGWMVAKMLPKLQAKRRACEACGLRGHHTGSKMCDAGPEGVDNGGE